LKALVLLEFQKPNYGAADSVERVEEEMKEWFEEEGLVCPNLRLRERKTGIEMDLQKSRSHVAGRRNREGFD
jgi:hypothetical protein